jgi:hypothetical protein
MSTAFHNTIRQHLTRSLLLPDQPGYPVPRELAVELTLTVPATAEPRHWDEVFINCADTLYWFVCVDHGVDDPKLVDLMLTLVPFKASVTQRGATHVLSVACSIPKPSPKLAALCERWKNEQTLSVQEFIANWKWSQ